MSANIPVTGAPRQLERRAEPDEQVTEDQAGDPERLARVLMTLLRDVASLKRRWWPQHIDFEDRVVDATGTTKYRLNHGFGARVRWWVVDWVGNPPPDSSTFAAFNRHASSDANTLVLVSFAAGTATIRVEEAGA